MEIAGVLPKKQKGERAMKKRKRGFTIVELVIVIAVIAILAAVLIPTFTNLIKRANLSNDQSAIRNMNTIVTAENAMEEFRYPSDAVTALYANGWNEGKLSAYTKGYHYAYDAANRRFFLLDEQDAVVYPEGGADKGGLWAFYNNSRSDKIEGITNYIALSNVVSQQYFSEVFTGAAYTIDLYNHYISVQNTASGTTITLQNGVVAGNAADLGFEADESVKGRADASSVAPDGDGKYDGSEYVTFTKNGQGQETAVVIENLIFELGDSNFPAAARNIILNGRTAAGNSVPAMDVTFRNCSFILTSGMMSCAATAPYAGKLTFDGCTFDQRSAGNYCLTIEGRNDGYALCSGAAWSVAVTNCIVQSEGRGINLSSAAQEKTQRFVFTGNTFIINNPNGNSSNQMALQVAGGWQNIGLSEDDEAVVAFAENSVQAAFAAVRVHDEASFNPENAAYILSFGGNVLSEGVKSVVVKEGDTDAVRTAVQEAWENKFQ